MCTEIILIEMQDAYGSILYKLISEPPWDLKQCLIYIKRFWTPVFSLTISQKQCLKAIEDLLTLIQTCHGMKIMLISGIYKLLIIFFRYNNGRKYG